MNTITRHSTILIASHFFMRIDAKLDAKACADLRAIVKTYGKVESK